jgi:hypothetical protein
MLVGLNAAATAFLYLRVPPTMTHVTPIRRAEVAEPDHAPPQRFSMSAIGCPQTRATTSSGVDLGRPSVTPFSFLTCSASRVLILMKSRSNSGKTTPKALPVGVRGMHWAPLSGRELRAESGPAARSDADIGGSGWATLGRRSPG